MPDRRFNDDEVAAIFELASKTEHARLPSSAEGDGLTLAALQEIGREAGISAESIALAAQSLDQRMQLSSQRMLGLPIGVGRVVEFDSPLSDVDWEALVADLRNTFQARGVVRYDGPFRQWTNGNLQALLEPTRGGHRLRLQTVRGASRSMMGAGSLVIAGATATFITTALLGNVNNPGALSGIALMALMGAGMFVAGAMTVPGWARRRGAQFDQLLARLRDATQLKTREDPNGAP
jgi:hypothetical protein